MSSKVKFQNVSNTDYHSTLKKRVNEYFDSRGLSQHANPSMIFKATLLLSLFIGVYLVLILGQLPLPITLALWMSFGMLTAFVAVNVCHDAIHGAFSGNMYVNHLLGYIFYAIGANGYMWSITHNLAHHTYPNIEGQDEDIEQIAMLRCSPHQKWRKVHRHQHWYAFLFYCLSTLAWVFAKDYTKFFQKSIGGFRTDSHPTREHIKLFLGKSAYYGIYLAIPLLVMPYAWWQILIGFLMMHFIEGLTLSIIFMLAHVVEDLDFPLPDNKGNMDKEWAVHQMYTTADFARADPVVSFLAGGLNFQIEHHLFPRVCHIHYPSLSEIVKKTSEEYGLPYIDNTSFLDALRSHISLLKRLGKSA